MPRRKGHFGRKVLPDPKYKSVLVAKFVNQVMLDGKKSIAQTIVYDAFNIIESKTGSNALDVFTQAVENVKPIISKKEFL